MAAGKYNDRHNVRLSPAVLREIDARATRYQAGGQERVRRGSTVELLLSRYFALLAVGRGRARRKIPRERLCDVVLYPGEIGKYHLSELEREAVLDAIERWDRAGRVADIETLLDE
jgi:hypothetical protein